MLDRLEYIYIVELNANWNEMKKWYHNKYLTMSRKKVGFL